MAYRRPRYSKKRTAPRKYYGMVTRRVGGFQPMSMISRRMVMGTRSKNGFLKIVRRCNEVSVRNGNTAGTLTSLPEQQQVSFGTPVSNNFGFYDIPFSIKFRLDNLINSGDITTLCDKYKIAGAYVRIFYTAAGYGSDANVNSGINAINNMPAIQYITDHDDAEVPSPALIGEKMGVKYHTFKNMNSYIALKVRPVPSREIYNNGVTTAYEVPGKAPFIDCNKSGVEHYGVKGIIRNVFLPSNANGVVGFRYDIALKVYGKDFQ